MKNRCVSSRKTDLGVFFQVLNGLDSEVSRACVEELARADYKGYLSRTIDESKYEDWRDFYRDYASISLLSKWQHFDLGVDRADLALKKFLSSETTCQATNERFAALNRTAFPLAERLPSYLNMARGKIGALLPDFNWDLAWPYMGFGPGACTDLGRAKGDAFYKFGLRRPSTTGANVGLASCVMHMIPQWETTESDDSGSVSLDGHSFTLVDGNHVTTVPKSAKIDRVIAIEPTMNMFVQKGIGGLLRKLLKRRGVNLDSQKRNQLLAKAGSEVGRLATLDLSSASDSVALGLVEWLLPPDWVTALEQCRSPVGTLPDGTKILYQKISSMGNGFTFELESLIFWALCSSVVSHLGGSESDVAVYGDDIVVPVDCVDECVRLLEFCGFTLNMDKSFWRGSFRESCGMHYFKGHDVTPLYVKDRVDDQDRKVWLCNSIKLLAHRLNGHGWGLDGQLRSSYETVRLSLPSWLQVPRIPHTMGHGALWGDFDEVAPRRAKHQLDGWEVQFVTRVFKQRVCSGVSVLIKSLWGLRKEPPRLLSFDEDGLVKSIPDGVDLTRIPLVKFRRIRVKGFAARWESLGPWLESLSTS